MWVMIPLEDFTDEVEDKYENNEDDEDEDDEIDENVNDDDEENLCWWCQPFGGVSASQVHQKPDVEQLAS